MSDLLDAVEKHSGLSDEELEEVAEHGASTGWPGFTYYTDTCKFYDEHDDLIWEALAEDAENMGVSPIEMISGFTEARGIENYDTFKNLLAWYALEHAAQIATCQ